MPGSRRVQRLSNIFSEACPVCSKPVQRRKLKRHLKRNHPDSPVTAKLEGKGEQFTKDSSQLPLGKGGSRK